MENIWFSKAPVLRIFIPFVAGILLGLRFVIPNNLIIISAICLILSYSVIKFVLKVYYQNLLLKGVLISLLYLVFGASLSSVHRLPAPQTAIPKQIFLGKIIEEPSHTPERIKLFCRIYKNDTTNAGGRQYRRILLYMKNDTATKSLKLGDHLLFYSELRPIENQKNPNAIDFKKIYQRKKIVYQAFIAKGEWRKIKNKKKEPIFMAKELRSHILKVYRSYGFRNENFSVLSAITLGYKEELSSNQKTAFSKAGAMHVLAVSGLHVGIIYLVLLKALFFIKRRPVQFAVIIMALWFYALLTGASPSVCRATTMLSFIELGRLLNRQSNVYNSIFASAILLILINPYVITYIGFQLSYLAVLSIIFFFPKLYGLVYFKNTVIDKVWQLICVSIAAQIGTIPLSLYYFNSFAIYFLVTNLVAIPLTTLIIVLALCFLAMSGIPQIAELIASVLQWVLDIFNQCMEGISQWDYSTISQVFVPEVNLIAIYLGIFFFALFLNLKDGRYIKIIFSLAILVLVLNIHSHYKQSSQGAIVIYDNYKYTMVDFIQGHHHKLFVKPHHDSVKRSDIEFCCGRNWLQMGVKNNMSDIIQYYSSDSLSDSGIIFRCGNFIKFQDYKIYMYHDERYLDQMFESKIDVDDILISKCSPNDFKPLLLNFTFNRLILDASISKWQLDAWIDRCNEHQIDYYSIRDQGAFIWEVRE